MRPIVLRHNHQARRAPIEAVHDARTHLAADSAEVVDLMEQRMDQGALRMPAGGMHDHAGRLVHDNDIRVLIDDVEFVIFRLRNRADRGGDFNGDRVALSDNAVRRYRVARDGDLAFLDEPLNLRAGLAAQDAREVAIDAYARLVSGNMEIVAKRRMPALLRPRVVPI